MTRLLVLLAPYGSLKGGIPTLPGWPFGVVDLPKVRYGDDTSA